jgi:hypothetical protein
LEQNAVKLWLEVTDAEVATELVRYEQGADRDGFALGALRLGVLALRQVRGELDAHVVRHEGERLLAEIRTVLVEHATRVAGEITGALKVYLDPASGSLPVRLERLVKADGDLESLLRAHLGGESSALARTLSAAIGEQSPIVRLLSPTQSDGLLAGITRMIETALDQHRARVIQEFSLDRPESALSRLIHGIVDRNGELKAEFKADLSAVVRQFSLDDPQSALSRLAREVGQASQTITQEFSLDLDGSSLSRLRREFTAALETLARSQTDFQSEVRTTLESFRTRRQEAARSTRHGLAFEALVCETLDQEARRLGDVFSACGASVGRIRNCKVGDAVSELGPDSAAPGSRIVVEAKAERGYDVERALGELKTARDNRNAGIGIFVFARRVAPPSLEPLSRFGADILVAWDDEDPVTDIYLRAAYSVGRALLVARAREASEATADFELIDSALLEITRKAETLDEVATSAQTIPRWTPKTGQSWTSENRPVR